MSGKGQSLIEIRPYARLLTMLGEQLIKNERVALMELIKNSYDADAQWVKLEFLGFGENYNKSESSKIVLSDNGHGITKEVIEKHLAHPATPEKRLRKEKKPTTEFGRVIQGEKGIGRFAILKLGRVIRIITRAIGDKVERVIDYDFSRYDDEFLTKDGKQTELYINQLTIQVNERAPEVFVSQNTQGLDGLHGTKIEITNLKGEWSERKIGNVYKDVARLQSIFSDLLTTEAKKEKKDIFDVIIYKDDKALTYLASDYKERLLTLMAEKSVIRVEDGHYDEVEKEYRFKLNSDAKKISLFNPVICGLPSFNQRFGNGAEKLKNSTTKCGSFDFGFYIFDFRSPSKVHAKHALDKKDKDIIKEHRIYLYRDGIRVFPYGEPDDDWLGIDVARGTISASAYLSNNQIVGFVNISQKSNPDLADKTNREGLIEHEGATDDFIEIIRGILSYLNKEEFKLYKKRNEDKHAHDVFKGQQVDEEFQVLKQEAKGNSKLSYLIELAEKKYHTEREYLIQRAETTEDLASVGLSVETASHDIMAIMSRTVLNLDGLIKEVMTTNISHDRLINELQSVRGGLTFVESQIKDIQVLFKSSKQRKKSLRVEEILNKVERIYKIALSNSKVKLEVVKTKVPLVAKTTDAVLLQLLINLFDNSIYWLNQIDREDKVIEVFLDGNDGIMVFSDNGPGIPEDDADYVFEPFFSGKGQEGRGLGLFIAKQLLERYDYTIELAENRSEKRLPGANFVVSFVS